MSIDHHRLLGAGFLIDLPTPFDPTDRMEGFLQKAGVSPFHDDPIVRAAISQVQGYLRDRLAPLDRPKHEPSASTS